MTFVQAIEKKLNTTQTDNFAKAYASTGNKCLDLFGSISACRNDIHTAEKLFLLAFDEHPETAIRALFYSRDIRGGQGERAIFRAVLNKLAKQNNLIASKLVELVPYYGRWDDLMCLEDTLAWNSVLELIRKQITFDLNSDAHVSLLGKWLPSINASSKNSKRLGRKIAFYLGWTEKQYRKNLATLRAKIKIVETPMCFSEWDAINYEKVPSRAAFMYRNAFKKHDETRYNDYLSKVEKGEAKINSSTLYPYDIVKNCMASSDKTLDLQWNSLPDYMEGKPFKGLVVADVSGSMKNYGSLPLHVSISLAIYISERNPSQAWKNKFMTFSEQPELVNLVGSTISDKVNYVAKSKWGYNTDLILVFKTILSAAEENNVLPEDMPEKLIIVSDMQFDKACASNKRTNFEQIQKMYKKSGYKMPDLIFWNVAASSNVPIQMHDTGTALVSGCSPSILKSIFNSKNITPLDVMMETLYSDRYALIGEALA